MTSNDDYVLAVLIEEGAVIQQRIDMLDIKNALGSKVDALIENNIISHEEILAVLASRFGLTLIDLALVNISQKTINCVCYDIAIKYDIIPIKKENNVLTIAIGDPLNVDMIDSLRYILNCEIEAVVANIKSIRQAINRYYGVEEKMNVEENGTEKLIYINELPSEMKDLWYNMAKLCKYREFKFTRCKFKEDDQTRSCHYSNCPCVEIKHDDILNMVLEKAKLRYDKEGC